ncbi:MAG: large conductance mechanosensitive channel protein MscL [Gemmatimonadaceae bacterium]|nr:large conductance mechanosensitive channel protein MscL [Chitinophagaceae bacterium]
MGFIKEFRDFAIKGNFIDLAIGVVLGAAFGTVVSSIVDDIIMPLLNPLMPSGGWQAMMLGPMAIGKFLSAVIKFIIVAFALFIVVKGINRMKKKEIEAPTPGPSSTDVLLTEIRDSLRNRPV